VSLSVQGSQTKGLRKEFMSRSGPGPFIYKGSGKVQSKEADAGQRLCVKQACNIQYCLQKFNHQEDKGKDVIETWRECTKLANEAAHKDARGSETGSETS
jgi:Mature-T-Cell Proliferation I type